MEAVIITVKDVLRDAAPVIKIISSVQRGITAAIHRASMELISSPARDNIDDRAGSLPIFRPVAVAHNLELVNSHEGGVDQNRPV